MNGVNSGSAPRPISLKTVKTSSVFEPSYERNDLPGGQTNSIGNTYNNDSDDDQEAQPIPSYESQSESKTTLRDGLDLFEDNMRFSLRELGKELVNEFEEYIESYRGTPQYVPGLVSKFRMLIQKESLTRQMKELNDQMSNLFSLVEKSVREKQEKVDEILSQQQRILDNTIQVKPQPTPGPVTVERTDNFALTKMFLNYWNNTIYQKVENGATSGFANGAKEWYSLNPHYISEVAEIMKDKPVGDRYLYMQTLGNTIKEVCVKHGGSLTRARR